MEQLIERMEGSTDPAVDTVLPVELIARRSTAPHPRSAEVQWRAPLRGDVATSRAQ